MQQRPKSVYSRGAHDGLYMGCYLSLLMIAIGASMEVPLLSLPAIAGVIGVPFVIYRFLKRSYANDGYRSTFAALWVHGICIFFFGGLLMALTVYLTLRFGAPGYVAEQTANVIAAYREIGSAQATEFADLLQAVLDAGALPTPAEIAVELVWMGVFSGSLLSILVALIVRSRRRSGPPPYMGAGEV